jgi:nucleoside-diphosphate-sugar epimerase
VERASKRKVFVLGGGYVGSELAQELLSRRLVPTVAVRSEATRRFLHQRGLDVVCGDAAEPSFWEGFSKDYEFLVHCASSNRGGLEAYRRIFLLAVDHALRFLPTSRLIFFSSTSVYGQSDGSWVDEESPADPATETGKVLREAEQKVLARGGTVLRVAGIYGPGRCVLLQRLLSGGAKIPGDPRRYVNQVHRDDVVRAALFALGLPPGVYNVVDDEPVPLGEYYRWICEQVGIPQPAFELNDRPSKRGRTNKRVSNKKLKSFGWEPRWATFRHGLALDLAALRTSASAVEGNPLTGPGKV